MDCVEFRQRAIEMIDYICKYQNSMSHRRVTPDVEPGYLRELLPKEAPKNPDDWDAVMKDVESKIMPGMAHWQHPQFHAYFPAGTSYASILADMLGDAINCIGFSWASGPAATELESIVVDWMAKAIGLPESFMFSGNGSKGGGVIQSSASECILISMLAARAQAIRRLKMQHPLVDEGLLLTKLIAYCSKEAHSCVEKAAMIAFVKIRIIDADEKGALDPKTLVRLMEEDEYDGLVPFFVSATVGTTATCSFDPLEEIGTALQGFPHVWLHVDGAYAGSAFICPELRQYFKGIEYANSFNMNPHKWLLTSADCSLLFVRSSESIASALVVDPLYLQHEPKTIDYRHWSIGLTRTFRSLKLWFVLRNYGISGLQEHIRNHVKLAKYFEGLVLQDDRFEICNEVKMGLVCFRLIGNDLLTERLLSDINSSGLCHMVPATVNGKYVIRFSVSTPKITQADIDKSWGIISRFTNKLWITRDEIINFMERMTKEKLASLSPYFVQVVCDTKCSESTINEPEFVDDSDDAAKAKSLGRQGKRGSWVSFPTGFLMSTDSGPGVPIV